MLVSYSDFFQYKSGSYLQQFDALLLDCFKNKGELCFTLRDVGVEIEVKVKDKVANVIQIFTSESDFGFDFFDKSLSKGVQMVLPLLIGFDGIYIPHHQIFALRRDKRTLADFCVRNLFYASYREYNVIFQTSFSPSLNFSEPYRDMSIRYLWVLRSLINESVLKERDTMNKMIINSYFQIFSFENKVLESGFEGVRNYHLDNVISGRQITRDRQIKQFMCVRENMMACFA